MHPDRDNDARSQTLAEIAQEGNEVRVAAPQGQCGPQDHRDRGAGTNRTPNLHRIGQADATLRSRSAKAENPPQEVAHPHHTERTRAKMAARCPGGSSGQDLMTSERSPESWSERGPSNP